MEILIVISICALILLLCMAGMAISILVKKNGKFPETEVSSNKNMRKLGLMCAKQEEILMLRKMKKKSATEEDCEACVGCFLKEQTE